MEGTLTLLGHTALIARSAALALRRETPVLLQTPPRDRLRACIPPPRLETGPANSLAVEPNLLANRGCLFSQMSDAAPPQPFASPAYLTQSREPYLRGLSLCCSPNCAEACKHGAFRQTVAHQRSSELARAGCRRIPASRDRRSFLEAEIPRRQRPCRGEIGRRSVSPFELRRDSAHRRRVRQSHP